jgi:hypothetical protein
MKPYSRIGTLGMLAVPVLAAQLLITGPAFAAAAGSVVAVPASSDHSGMQDMPGMEDMPGMGSAPSPSPSGSVPVVPMGGMDGMDMGDMPGMTDTPSSSPSPTPSSSPSAGGGDMAGMEGMGDMPGMEHSHGSGTVAAPRGDEPARNVVLAGFGVFNLLVLLIAGAYRYFGGGSRRNRRNAARSAAGPATSPRPSKTSTPKTPGRDES